MRAQDTKLAVNLLKKSMIAAAKHSIQLEMLVTHADASSAELRTVVRQAQILLEPPVGIV